MYFHVTLNQTQFVNRQRDVFSTKFLYVTPHSKIKRDKHFILLQVFLFFF